MENDTELVDGAYAFVSKLVINRIVFFQYLSVS